MKIVIFALLPLFSIVLPMNPTKPTEVDIISLGYMPPKALSSLVYSLPVFDMAIEDINSKYNNVMKFNHVVIQDENIKECNQLEDNADHMAADWYYRTKRSPKEALSLMVIPGCVQGSRVDQLARAWNLFLITAIGTVGSGEHRDNPSRISTSYSSFGQYNDFFLSILKYFNWTTIFVVIDGTSSPIQRGFGNDLVSATTKDNLFRTYSHTVNTSQPDPYKAVLNAFPLNSRVMLYFGMAYQFVKFMQEAATLNLTTGEYVYIAADPTPNLPSNSLKYAYRTFDQSTREAFHSVLVLQDGAKQELNKEDHANAVEMQRRSALKFNFTYELAGKYEIINPCYSSLSMIAEVINECVTSSCDADLHDGTVFAKRFLNRTFNTRVGSIYIDPNGERRTNLDMYAFDESGNHTIIVRYPARSSELIPTSADVDWRGSSWPPLNEPICGYDHRNSKCRQIPRSTGSVSAVVVPVTFGLVVLGAVVFAAIRRVKKSASEWWKIPGNQISDVEQRTLHIY